MHACYVFDVNYMIIRTYMHACYVFDVNYMIIRTI